MNDHIERIGQWLTELTEGSSLVDSLSRALLASLEGHRPVRRLSFNLDSRTECVKDGETWPCAAVANVMEELGMTAPPVTAPPVIPEESKRVVYRSLGALQATLHHLRRAGAVVSAMTEDHKLVLVEVVWPGLGVVGSVEWDAHVEEWIITDRPV